MATKIPEKMVRHNRDVVFSTYRTLLRATSIAFKGDDHMLSQSRKFVRQNFDENRDVAAGSVEAENGINHALATAQILRENVVQGEKTASEQNIYKLNIHEHTERGDDEAFKTYKGTGKKFSDMKN